MPDPVRFTPRPFVREAYVPDNVSLLRLMQMAGQAQQDATLQRGQTKGQGLMNLGHIISQALGNWRQEGEQKQAFQARQQFEQQKIEEANQIKREEMAARAEERGLVEQQRQEVLARQGQQDTRQTAMDLAANMQPGVIDPRNADALRAYPGTAGRVQVQDGAPVLMRTPQQAEQARTAQVAQDTAKAATARQEATDTRLTGMASEAARHNLAMERRPVGGGAAGPRPLTQTAEAQIINRLSNQWIAANKPMKELGRQVELMKAGMGAVDRGDLAQGSQAVLVTFQKILDPPSVVRESEYMRSSAGQSLMNRVKGAADKLVRGGAGVTVDELRKFGVLAEEAATAQRRAANIDGVQSRLSKTAERYNIPPELIFEDASPTGGAPAPAATPPATQGFSVVAPDGQTYTFKSQSALDGFKARAGIK